MSPLFVQNSWIEQRIKERPSEYLKELEKVIIKRVDGGIIIDTDLLFYKEMVEKYAPARVTSDDILATNPNCPDWTKANLSWERAEHFIKSMYSRGIFQKKVELEIFEGRGLACHGNKDIPPCPFRAYNSEEKYHYCNCCGCGDKKIAALSVVGESTENKPKHDYNGPYFKHHFPYLACPIFMVNFSNYDPLRIHDKHPRVTLIEDYIKQYTKQPIAITNG